MILTDTDEDPHFDLEQAILEADEDDGDLAEISEILDPAMETFGDTDGGHGYRLNLRNVADRARSKRSMRHQAAAGVLIGVRCAHTAESGVFQCHLLSQE